MRVLISAGEPSGDRLGAELALSLGQRFPGLELAGLAGPAMRAAGVEALARVEDLSVMGVVEVLAELPRILRVRQAMFEALRADLLVVVDAPDFNLPLARRARAAGIPVVFLGSPQVWAWRRGRAAEIAELAAEVVCLLPFEPAIYAALGGRAAFYGHPAAGRVAWSPTGQGTALLPGSRGSELGRLLGPFLEAAAALEGPLRLGRAPGAELPDLPEGIELVEGLEAAARPSARALVSSGTATLELACMGRPMVVAYKVNALTYAIGRALVTGVEHIALPNLILGRRAVPELLQDFEPEDLVRELEGLEGQLDDLDEVRERMRGPGAGERIADAVAEHLP